MGDDERWEQISAALDGEAIMPPGLTADEQAFVDRALGLRGVLRVAEARRPPDVTEAVLQRLPDRRQRPRRRLLLTAAAAFLVAALAGVIAVRPGGPAAPRAASAAIAGRVIDGQRAITSFGAQVTVVERGAHPSVAERRLVGTLRYASPEQLWLRLEQQAPIEDGWPANDIDLVLDGGTAWLKALDDCPVGAQPACLRPSRHVVRDLAPFSPTWISPLDLIVPTDAFLPAVRTVASERDEIVTVDTTVARVDRLVEGLTSAGAIRSVHATDPVTLELDADTLTLRRLTVEAADNLARTTWAATNGYDDPAGTVVLTMDLDPIEAAPFDPPPTPDAAAVTAGFTDTPLDAPWPAPPGFELYRTGVLQDGGPRTEVYAYSDGRAWLRIDVTEEWDQPRLFGSLGPLVRPVTVGDGIGYTDPAGAKLSVHGAGRDLVVTGSVGLDVFAEAAAEIADGTPIDHEWQQAAHVDEIPDGALVPSAEHLAVLHDGELIIAVGGPGSTGIVLTQAPTATFPPPLKGDVIETVTRGVPARYSPRLGTLTWLENGWRRELRGEGLDLAELRSLAQSLVEP